MFLDIYNTVNNQVYSAIRLYSMAYGWYWRTNERDGLAGRTIPAVRNIGSTVMMATASRRFFITSSGYMGLAPCSAELADSVGILLGGSTPFILWQTPWTFETQSREDHTCSLVGDACVHGLMKGAALGTRKNGDVWKMIRIV